MKAVVWTGYGPPDVLQVQEVETPVPKDNEVRIQIRATTVIAGDCEMRRLELPLFLGWPMRLYAGVLRPTRITILGQELAGEVEAVGKEVTRFRPGDQVFGATGFRLGAYAEYICLPQESDDGVLAPMSASMSYEEAAAVPFGGLEALYFLKKAKIQGGERVLINGAGGSIGTFGVQLAKHYGAEVVAVDSAPKRAMLRSIGADRVIDYEQVDFTRSGDTYDVIFDVIGKSPYARSVRVLRPNGRYVLANPRLSHLIRGLLGSPGGGKKVISGSAVRRVEDLLFLRQLLEDGEIQTVIDRTYPLEEISEAHRYVETGAKVGNVVINV